LCRYLLQKPLHLQTSCTVRQLLLVMFAVPLDFHLPGKATMQSTRSVPTVWSESRLPNLMNGAALSVTTDRRFPVAGLIIQK